MILYYIKVTLTLHFITMNLFKSFTTDPTVVKNTVITVLCVNELPPLQCPLLDRLLCVFDMIDNESAT